MRGVSADPDSKDAQWEQFTAAMARYEPGHPAEIYSAWGWLAAQVAVEGLKRINGPITREAYVKALESIRNFRTLGGTLSYGDGHHGGIGSQFLWEAKGGHWAVVPNSVVSGS